MGKILLAIQRSIFRAPKKHISKKKDRDIPYNPRPPHNEAQQGRDTGYPYKMLMLMCFLGSLILLEGAGDLASRL